MALVMQPSNIINKYLHISIGNNFTQLLKRLVSSDVLELPIDTNELVLREAKLPQKVDDQPYQLINLVNSHRKIVDNINSYHKMYKQHLVNPNIVKDDLVLRLNTHISILHKKINVDNADINYYLDNIYSNKKTKFYDIIDQILLRCLIMDVNIIVLVLIINF